ncbi:replication initiator protein A [Salinisphaera sp. P385]|uniref:Replication initiator protein A n=1 Tax=Spectribacter acetivorans TaxID=3075603 RepID=A0ABU3BD54_9GAMM|nr:replication initiator protein A [Salinisphaera sp. P385]MDT0619955.1 replication initiator protein A [Salinisphaera sp. P385]
MADPLAPDRHRQRDFFVADILDAVPKDDLGTMEHPMFALRAGDRRVRRYEHKDSSIEIQPGAKGLATQNDKDILIYCISQLVAAINRGREPSRVVQLTAYDLLVSTNRRTDGDAYMRLQEALDRLRGTTVSTNIRTGDTRTREGFGLIDSYRIVERDGQERMAALEITLSQWLYRAVESMQVLSISRDYFRLRKPLERRLYEISRKHCGAQPSWRASLATLHLKSGSSASLKRFRQHIIEAAESDHLPDYRMQYDRAQDLVTIYSRSPKGALKQIQKSLQL